MVGILLLVLLLALLFGGLGYAVSPLFFVLLVAVRVGNSERPLWRPIPQLVARNLSHGHEFDSILVIRHSPLVTHHSSLPFHRP